MPLPINDGTRLTRRSKPYVGNTNHVMMVADTIRSKNSSPLD